MIDMGGKGKSQSWTPPAETPQYDASAIAGAMEGMMGMMGGMMESYSQQISTMQESMLSQMENMGTPEVVAPPPIDWTEKQQQLAAKVKADYSLDQTRRKGIADSIHTSPLLDDEDAETTNVSLVAQQ